MAKKEPVKKAVKKTVKKVAKKTAKKKKEVRIGSSNVKERNSRNHFELVMSPWVCTGTAGADHGHDYHVEVVSSIDIDDYKPDGRFFLVQLKSQTKLIYKDGYVIPHPIETRKIRQWYNSSAQIPFLLVVNDLTKGKFFYTWVDEEFISTMEKESPFWSKNEKVSIRISDTKLLTEEIKVSLREYVFNYKYYPKKILEPGTFFAMKEKVTGAIQVYETLVQSTPFESVKKDVQKLKEVLENAVYRIAITGLSRVGKSTLINALLKRPDISPTDVWQTTGVPILINPGKEEKVQINYNAPNKASDILPYSPQIIKEFAAREFNEDNYKGVRDVSVYISSSQLERGVMFYDIPGLDDPNDDIMEFAYHTADCANVILYIIDGASAKTGSFVFKNDYKKHIEKFSQSKDKILLIVNKVDELPLERLQGLKLEIEKNLTKYNLKSKIAPKVYYLSMDPSNTENLKSIKGEINTLDELETDLWSFMLTENKIGFFKLYSLMRELQQSVKQIEQIIRARSLDANNKTQLVNAINAVKKKIPDLEKHIKSQNQKIRNTITNNLELRKNAIIENLETSLDEVNDMPSDDSIKSFLVKRGYNAVSKTHEDLAMELGHLKEHIDKWIEDNLKQVRDIISLENKDVNYSLKDIEEIKLPAFDFSSTWGTGILGAIAGFFINPLVGTFAIGLGIGGAIIDLFIGKEGRKAKRIRKVIDKVRRAYSQSFSDVNFKYNTIVDEQMSVLIGYINRKLKLYFSDIESQVSSFNLHPTFDYITFEKNSENKIPEINEELGNVWEELQIYLSVIKPL